MQDLNVYGPFLSKKLAAHKGLKQFFEGKECKRGHIDARQLANGRCMECQRQRKLELYYNPDLGKRKEAPTTVKRRVSNRVSTLTAPDFKAIAEKGYFVYAWIRQRDLTPWYIGKACPRDPYRPHAKNHTYSPPSNRALIRILRSGLATEEEAHQWERAYIKRYKRRDMHPDGVLFNHTDGGEGTSGYQRDPEQAKEIGRKTGQTQLENHRAWEPLGITHERWESLTVTERAALRYFVMANPGTTGNDYFEGNYTKWQSSEAGLEHQQQAAAIGAANKKKAAAEKWGLSLEDYLSLTFPLLFPTVQPDVSLTAARKPSSIWQP